MATIRWMENKLTSQFCSVIQSLSRKLKRSVKILTGGATMASLLTLPINGRIKLVEDIWDSIAADQTALPITEAQKKELEKRLKAYEND